MVVAAAGGAPSALSAAMMNGPSPIEGIREKARAILLPARKDLRAIFERAEGGAGPTGRIGTALFFQALT
jgi:hypothetical protein